MLPIMMKTKLLSAVASCLLATTIVSGAPLTGTTAIHTKPDASSPTISYLKAGTEPAPVADAMATTPAGWMAVEVPGPVEGFAEGKDFTKGLEIKAGTAVHSSPDAKSPVIAVAEKGEKTTITGVHGRWTQFTLDRKVVGYISVGGTPDYVPPIATTPATSAQSQPLAPAPISPIAYGVGGAGQPAPTVSLSDSSSLPRQIAGIFVSTRSILHPRRPYDWALNDNAGKRYAYVDISKLLLTDQIEKYVDHWVVIFGALKPTADGKDIVIQAESLQLK